MTVIGMQAFQLARAQDTLSWSPKGRNAEEIPYPFRHFSFISPRYSRLYLGDHQFSESYFVRTLVSLKGRIHLRLDVPVVRTNTTSDGKVISGLGDVTFKVIKTFAQKGSTFFGGALLGTFPTASHTETGSGKYQLDPQVGGFYIFPKESGSVVLALDYNFSYAGHASRNDISVLGIMPNIDWWGKRAYAGYYPVWTYNFKTKQWDIPLDIEAGYMVVKKFYVSAEWIYPLLKDKTYLQMFIIKLRYAILQGRPKTTAGLSQPARFTLHP